MRGWDFLFNPLSVCSVPGTATVRLLMGAAGEAPEGLPTKTTVGDSVGVKLPLLLSFQASQVSSKVNYDLWKCCLRGYELSSGDVWREQAPCFLIKAINAVDLLEKTLELLFCHQKKD